MISRAETPDGGAAFPHDNQELGTAQRIAHPGMSLRDYFAAHALKQAADGIGDTSVSDLAKELGLSSYQEWCFPQHYHTVLAKRAYAIADAMLSARSTEDLTND